MEIYIQESLYVLDYNNNIIDLIYKSDDKDTPGYAFDISVEEANTGYSNLSFSIPTSIVSEGQNISNPKLSNINALTKLRYERVITYMGDTSIVIVEPVNNFEGDTQEITYSKGDIMENYIMDYIIQPFEQTRQDIQINNSFNAIDYPRFVLSKKEAGLTINENTLTTEDLSLCNNKPVDIPGTVKYIKWTDALNVLVGKQSGSSITWNPKDVQYPLTDVEIQTLLNGSNIWDYGVLATVFYWPVTDTARLEGVLYEEGNFIGLNIYNTLLEGYDQSTTGYTPLLDNLAINWLQIDNPDVYLSPNNGLNYLKYLLINTGWKVDSLPSTNYIGVSGQTFDTMQDLTDYITAHSIELTNDSYSVVDGKVYKWTDTLWVDVTDESFGHQVDISNGYKYNVDIEKEEIYLPGEAEQGTTENVDKTCSLQLSDSNCYNAITTLGTQLQLYPYFNCVKKTVGLKARPGKNNGLAYQYGVNIQSNGVSIDGEKVITKLFVSGGTDANGNININIGTANRNTKGDNVYPSGDGIFTWVDDPAGVYSILCPVEYIISTADQTYTSGYYYKEDGVYKYCSSTSPSSFITLNPSSIVKFTIDGTNYNVKDYNDIDLTVEKWFNDLKARLVEFTGTAVKEVREFNPNDPAYLESRTPSGTDYILNFKYLYDRNYITRENILDIYKNTLQIGLLQKRYVAKYITDYARTNSDYLNAINKEEMTQVNWSSALNAMMNIYYVNPSLPSQGTFYAFADQPVDAKTGADLKALYTSEDLDDLNDSDYYVRIADGSIVYGYVNTPIFPDGNVNAGDNRYTPKQKGFALQTIEQLGFDSFKYIWPALRSLTSSEILAVLSTIASTDPSGTVSNYDVYAKKFINYYKESYLAHNEVISASQNIADINLLYQEYQEQINTINGYLQEHYGDYIIEGFYKNENQPYANLLFNEAIDASDKFGYPDITYSLNVIDSSGLFEYRNRTNDTFNELVHYLHSIGQIVPRAGDEVTIIDSALGMLGVPGLITTIVRNLDNPMENSITIDTGFTDEEELVGNIITATNTVLNNTDIYARTAILNKDGTIDSDSLATSLSNPNTKISLVGSGGSSIFDSSGVLVSDSTNTNNQLKVSNGNLLTSTDGGLNWNEIITPEGLNINHATIGTIDTTRVSIMDGDSKKVILNNNGLVVKNDPDRGYEIGGEWDNVKAFVGVDNTTGKNGQVYIDGMIRATQGSEIAGWSIDDDKMYKSGTGTYVGLSSNASDPAIVAGTSSNSADYKFTVANNGAMTASNANVSGTISSTNGNIGGWTINSAGISAGTTNATAKGMLSGDNYAFYAGHLTPASAPFRVTQAGVLQASNVNITGGSLTLGTNFSVTDTGQATMKINGNEIFNSSGVLTNLQFNSTYGETDVGWYSYSDSTTDWNEVWRRHGLVFYVNIPANFQVVSASVLMFHVPCYSAFSYDNGSGLVTNNYWCYCRALKLYKVSTLSTLYYSRYGLYNDPDYSALPKTEVSTAFGSSGWTASVPNASSHGSQFVTSGDISASITAGPSIFLIDTAENPPATVDNNGYITAIQKTARMSASINIIGYMKV